MRAIIVHEVELKFGEAEVQTDEPQMQLETGEVVTAYDVDRYIPLDTKGEATYDDERNIWTFAPDE